MNKKINFSNTFSSALKLISCQFKQTKLCEKDNGKVHGWRYAEDSTS
jgi:hypothetical protein